MLIKPCFQVFLIIFTFQGFWISYSKNWWTGVFPISFNKDSHKSDWSVTDLDRLFLRSMIIRVNQLVVPTLLWIQTRDSFCSFLLLFTLLLSQFTLCLINKTKISWVQIVNDFQSYPALFLYQSFLGLVPSLFLLEIYL